MNWIKENWFKIGILVILIVSIGGAFYWYEWKPNKIKQRCSAEARFDSRATLEPAVVLRQKFINNYYDDCLMRFGLK